MYDMKKKLLNGSYAAYWGSVNSVGFAADLKNGCVKFSYEY